MQHSCGQGQSPGVGSSLQEAALNFCVPSWLTGSQCPQCMHCVCLEHTHTVIHSLYGLSAVKRETRSGDPGQQRNAKVLESGSCVLALIGF